MTDEIRQTIKIEAELTQVQAQLRTLEGNFKSSFSNIGGIARNALGAFGIGLGAGALVGFAKNVLANVSALKDLELQTGITAQTLSGIQNTVDNAGISVEEFASGWARLVRGIAQGDSETNKAVQTLKNLGFTAEQIQGAFQDPEEFLARLAKRLAEIQNPVERLAVAQELAGRSGARWAAALVDMADGFDQLRSRGLTQEQIDRLDAFAKNLERIKNAIVLLAAGPIDRIAQIFAALTGTATQKDVLGEQLRNVKTQIAAIDRDLARLAGASDPLFDRQRGIMRAQLEALGKTQADIERQLKAMESPRTGAGRGALQNALGDPAKQQKQIDLAKQFLGDLDKQLGQIHERQIGLTLGPDAQLGAALDRQLAELKARAKDAGIALPADIDKEFLKLKESIVGANAELRRMDDLQKSLADTAQMLNADSAEWLTAMSDAAKIAADNLERIKPQFEDLERTLAIEILPPEQQGEARRLGDFHGRLELIEQFRTASIAAGGDVQIANERAAEATRRAWEASLQGAAVAADESTEFMTRAVERVQDAVAGGIEDLLSGNVKSWQDWAASIKKVIDQVVSQFLAAQLNAALFGPQASQGQFGGILGSILGLFGGGSPSSSQFTGAATGYEAGFFHEGGAVKRAAMGDFTRGGLKVDEVPAVLQRGEFVLSKSTVGRIGVDRLDRLNRMHDGGPVMRSAAFDFSAITRASAMSMSPAIAGASTAGRSGGDNNYGPFIFQGVQDANSFRKSKPNIMADLARAVERGRKHT